jgi:glycosyltransferase involved in cell wall biosynthesis
MSSRSGKILINAQVPLHLQDGVFLLEDQAQNGLRLWAENFDHVTVMLPVSGDPVPASWRPIDLAESARNRVTIVPLPMAYRPDQFLRKLGAVRATIHQEIEKASYLSFAIGGLFGDWGSVACHEALRMKRPYAVWTDRVESSVVRSEMHIGHWRKRLRSRLYHRPMARLERFLIRNSTLGLFHGRETFEAYAPYCPNPHVVHDIHINKSDHITADHLGAKIAAAGQRPLKIIYTGRAEPMKGPIDWIETLDHVHRAGIEFSAQWLGVGSELARMEQEIAARGLSEHVALRGFVSDRADLLDALRDADLFLFCHKTPESPRCLIESLISGTPIIGYDGAFARDLIHENSGGQLVGPNDTRALAEQIISISQDPSRLGNLMRNAAADGTPYDDVSVFRHRSDLIKAHLPLPPSTS